jgi:mannose-6-phosphate isomerase-like protein (cupin superfamily)
MRVADQEIEVEPGTLILIEPHEEHSIRALGDEPLTYISATTPAFEIPSGRWATPPAAHSSD